MYLVKLTEEVKQNFLDLAQFIAKSDSKFSDEEKEMLEVYAHEMGIPCVPAERELDDILTKLKEASSIEKKIIIFELVGLVVVDDDYSAEEKDILGKTLEVFELSSEFLNECLKQVAIVKANYNETSKMIFG